MFIQRLITSLFLVPLVLLILFYGNPLLLGGVLLFITLAIGWESWQLIPIKTPINKAAFIVLLVFSVWLCGYLFNYWQTGVLLLWLFLYLAIVCFPLSTNYWGYAPIVAVILLLIVPLFIQSLIRVFELPQGKSLLLYAFFLVWAADVGAYLVGKRLGKHRMIPQVSPGKSWEGVAGGFILALLVGIAGFIYYKPYSLTIWLFIAAFTTVSSIFGDLFISMLKRRCNLKDTGTIIPGHGGVLDRLDSLIAALPVFYLGLTYIPLGI